MTISVIISTFGEACWTQVAQRAIDSACNQTEPAHEVIYNHGSTLHETRNLGAEQATGRWLCFLDGDDELDENFIAEMTRKRASLTMLRDAPYGYLVRPATLGVYPDGREDEHPVVLPQTELINRNFMVISTLVDRDLFLQVGGFADWPIYEDWDLWLRCARAGARISAAEKAILRIHVAEESRNQQDRETQIRYFNEIRAQYVPQRRRGRLR